MLMVETQSAVSIDRLSVVFERDDGTRVQALRDVSLDIGEGEFVCVLGRSGHGKTTLLNVVAGLIPSYSGDVRVLGKPVKAPGVDRGVIFQKDAVFPWMRVEDNVAFGLRVSGMPKPERLRVAREHLDLVGLRNVPRAWPRELSGGMRARVAVAGVFASDPPILLADEPFGALDYVTRRQLQDVLLSLWERTGKTIMFVTHDVDEALRLATRVIVVSNGSVVEDQAVDLPMPRSDDALATPRGLELRHLLLHHIGLE
ncbi:ABC transporter ATP-binding protein [Bauldia sp.]|uniref:ABC transporter ATP-binding protein n=1 Tax=Bauldia sp. TaxID=2575872 RepID=UPI0025BAB980|nr:ABC transporter ATP-binding protein [Bauldia sp.]